MFPDNDRYQCERELGSGAMGTVYLAKDTKLKRNVTIKVLHPHLLVKDTLRKRFLNEARAIASVNHPNIVSLYDVVDGEHPFLVMEYIQGHTLEHYLAKNASLPNLVLFELTQQLLEGLAAAHESHIIHRDIKPSNIIIDPRGYVKITDFGVAHILNQDTLTVSGQILGTPQYISPEVVKMGCLSDKSDLFSAGCLLYRAATGTSPFPGDNPHHVMQNICNTSPQEPSEQNPKIFAVLGETFISLLAKKPEERPAIKSIQDKLVRFITESELQVSRQNLLDYTSSPADYTRKENHILYSYYHKKAQKAERNGNTTQAHRYFYQAGLFNEDSGTKKWVQQKSFSFNKTAFLSFLAGVCCLGLFAFLFYDGLFQKENVTHANSQIQEPLVLSADTIITKTKIEVSDTESVVTQPPTTKPSPKGFLLIKTRPPFAQIFLGGKDLGKTPLSTPTRINAGIYKLVIQKKGCKTLQKTIRISKNDTLILAFELERIDLE
ncbi:MAG: serine/threonine protein kinase [Fibrobacteria bacterium]|nr:serine/threonine protein kinase [Fibrobacteria bacterium]